MHLHNNANFFVLLISSMIELLFILSIIALTFLVYSPTWNNKLIVDDYIHAKQIGEENSLFKNIPLIENIKRRFYGVGTLASKNGKINIFHEHIFRTSIHALICILMFLVFSKTTNPQIAFCAAILYSLNPINNQTSVWLNGRRYAINIVLVLAMMLFTPFGVMLYFLMPHFQINAIFSPILLGGYWWLLIPAFFIVGNGIIISKYRERASIIQYDERKQFKLNKIIIIIKSFGYYFFKMIIPGTTYMYSPKLYFWGMTQEGNKDAYAINADFLKGILAIIISITGLFYFKEILLSYWIFMLLATIQWSNIITVTQTFADRYMSLPNVFMMFFISYLTHQFLGQNAVVFLAFLAGYYITQLQTTFRMYRSPEEFYDYHIYFNKQDVSARSFKSSDLISQGDNLTAWEVVKQGLRYNPNDFKMLYQAALCFFQLDKIGNKEIINEYLCKAEKNIYLSQEKRLQKLIDKLRGATNV